MQLQPDKLSNEWVTLVPLQETDFERLFQVASDPLIWEQHPNKLRYQRPVFENFFKGAIESGGAFIILDSSSGEPIGSTRFYDYNDADQSVKIGYTFYARSCWGKAFNRSAKTLMINYAFQFVQTINFDIGSGNIRSQKAIERIGAVKTGEEEVTYFGETPTLNFRYTITKNQWHKTAATDLR